MVLGPCKTHQVTLHPPHKHTWKELCHFCKDKKHLRRVSLEQLKEVKKKKKNLILSLQTNLPPINQLIAQPNPANRLPSNAPPNAVLAKSCYAARAHRRLGLPHRRFPSSAASDSPTASALKRARSRCRFGHKSQSRLQKELKGGKGSEA